MIATTEAVTSGPIPSPGRSVILCGAIEPSFHAPPRVVERKIERKHQAQLDKLGQFAQTALHALQSGRDEVEVMQPSSLDGLAGERAEDFDGALEQGSKVAGAESVIRSAQNSVVADQLQFKGLSQNPGHSAIPQQGGQIVRIRTHS